MNAPLMPLLLWLKRHSGLAAALSLRCHGSLKEDGWFRSVSESASVDAADNPIPWLCYPAVRFLEKRITPEMAVFEFGSGYSTLWWSRRVRKVIACEANEKWHIEIRRLAPTNTEVVFAKEEDYPSTIALYPAAFDVVVIDGGDRVACAPAAVAGLNQHGVIIWDDTERPEYESGFDFLRQCGFARIEFSGMGPLVNIAKETSIFYRPENIFAI